MKNNLTAAGVFVVSAIVLFSVGLFLIGDHHKAFTHHVNFYTDLTNVSGLPTGAKIRVSGFDAGQVTGIHIPDRPSGKFRLRLHIDGKLHNLIRTDSLVTVETDGLVGDKYLEVHDGSDHAAEAVEGATLPSKEPVELSAVIAKATGVMDQANATIGEVRGTIGEVKGKLNGALDSITATVNNTNGIVTGIRGGQGTVGVLLKDKQAADDVKAAVGNARQATANLNRVSAQAQQVMTDFQSRNLPAKASETLDHAKNASVQIDQASQTVNATLNEALGEDRSGQNAGQNIRETLSNVNLATANMAEDTEALKHEFFFKGFFKKRGFYELQEMTPEQYRTNSYVAKNTAQRDWLAAAQTFASRADGSEVLSPEGKQGIDQVIANEKNTIAGQPVIVEGYSQAASAADQMTASRTRALLVKHYLEGRFHLLAKNVGAVPLNATPPPNSGKDAWDGISIVFLKQPR